MQTQRCTGKYKDTQRHKGAPQRHAMEMRCKRVSHPRRRLSGRCWVEWCAMQCSSTVMMEVSSGYHSNPQLFCW